MRRAALLSSLLLVAACAVDSGTTDPASSDAPAFSTDRLTRTTVAFEGRAPVSLGQDVVAGAVRFLAERGDTYGVVDAANLAVVRTVRDELGMTHVRVQQTHGGVPVVGGDIIVHLRGDAVSSVSGSLVKDVSVDSRPSVTSAVAQSALVALMQQRHLELDADVEELGQPELLVVPTAQGDKLTWRFSVLASRDGEAVQLEVLIDAHSAAVLQARNVLETGKPGGGGTGSPTGPAVGSGRSLYSGTVAVNGASWSTGGFAMFDPTRGNARTTNMGSRTNGSGTVLQDADNVWGNGTNSDPATVGIDAHLGMEKSYDYFKNVHGRSGIDGQNNASLPAGYTYSRVHYGRNYNNAFWSDSCGCMTYGDGDGSVLSPLASLDVAAHEQSHGLTSRTAKLVYSGESGGLNESVSDIFGEMVERYTRGSNDWLVGAEIYTPATAGDALRYFDRPSRDGRSKDAWYQGIGSIDVHYSSGPANNAFYLLVNGGTNFSTNLSVTGIGADAAERIWFRALTKYWTSTTNYQQARAGVLSAAADLYGAGSANYNAAAAAFSAINVN